MGVVRLNVNDKNARTIFPDINENSFQSFNVIFYESPSGKERIFSVQGGFDDVEDNAGKGGYLVALGSYDKVVVEAFYTSDNNNRNYLGARGESGEFKVPDDTNITVVLNPFDKTLDTDGTFEWKINYSANSSYDTAEMTIKSKAGTSGFPKIINFFDYSFDSSNFHGSETYPPGIYEVSFEFGKTGYSYVKFPEILYIAPGGAISKYEYTIPKLASTTVSVKYNLNPNNPYFEDEDLGTITVGSLITGEIYTKLSAFIPDDTKNVDFDPTEVFKGWYKDKAGTKLWNFSYDRVLSDTILHAKWEVKYTTSPMGIELKWIPAGTFTMGSPTDEPGRGSNETQHSVKLNKGFYIGKYQVTQEQWEMVMGSNPSYFITAVDGESGTPGKLPVEMVSFYDAIVFCNKLSMMEAGLSPVYSIGGSTNPADWGAVPTSVNTTWNNVTMAASANGYRLPTEAEWEYACRAGTTSAYNTGDTISDDTGWYNVNSGNKTHKVGLKLANAWGLYDMHGNVYELCWDVYKDNITMDTEDPTGGARVLGANNVMRGGLFHDSGQFLRSAFRSQVSPYAIFRDLGFRIVRSL